MALMRAIPLLLAASIVFLASCSTPPPPRVTTRTVYPINTALLLTSEDGKLSAEELQARHDEVVRYLTERGLLSPEDALVSNAATADRIIRVSIAESGGFKVTIFNPGSTGAYYSAAPVDASVTARLDTAWPTYDPWFDQGYYYSSYPAPGYYRYYPRDYLRPHYPRDYLAPVEPRRTPPPPVIKDPTPQPRPHDRNRPRNGRPDHRDRDDDGRPDWRDRNRPGNPGDKHDHGGRGPDVQPRPTPPNPRPPLRPPTRVEPQHTAPPRAEPPPPPADPPPRVEPARPVTIEPRPAPERARDEDRKKTVERER